MNGLRLFTVLLVLLVATNLYSQQSKLQSRPLYQSTQQALETLLRAETAREDGKREQYRAGISQIRAVEKELAHLLRVAYRQKPSQRDKQDWSLQELESLARHLKVQLARAYRQQALCYPAGSADRVNALSLAIEQLPNVITQPLDEAGVWQARVEQVVCLRLLNRQAEAEQQIERWQKLSPPVEIASQFADELRNLELESGNLTPALAREDPKLLAYAAAKLYASGKLSEAVAAYDRIAVLHAAEGDSERQFQTLKTAAAIVREMKQPEAAMVRFRGLALRVPKHREAASMHLVAIGLAAELAREATPRRRKEKFKRYVTLLNEHLQQWPKSQTNEKVRQWLARTEMPEFQQEQAQKLAAQGNRQQALDLYRKLLSNSPDDARLLEAYAKLLATGTEKAELQEALKLWQSIESRSKPDGQRWWRGRRARLELLEQLGEGGQAKKLRQLTEILHSGGVNDE